jgi:hypothetical protein
MKCISLKYILLVCVLLALTFKASNTQSFIKYLVDDIEYSLSNEHSTESEEKNIETEYFYEDFNFNAYLDPFKLTSKKIIIPNHLNTLNYFPEILIPPPLA